MRWAGSPTVSGPGPDPGPRAPRPRRDCPPAHGHAADDARALGRAHHLVRGAPRDPGERVVTLEMHDDAPVVPGAGPVGAAVRGGGRDLDGG